MVRICMPLLPLWLIRLKGRWLGSVMYACLREQRRLTLEHLEIALGRERAPAERRRIARRAFQRLVRIEGLEHVEQALARGKGLIVVSAHFGNWELLAAYFGMRGLRGGVVARRLRYPEYEAWLKGMRRAKGVETFDRETSFKELVRRLKDNQCIGIMPDQDVDSVDGVFVEFFGRPAYTPTGPAALALLTGAALVPAYIVREDGRFHLWVEPPMTVTATGDRARDLHEVTQAWSRVTERYISS